MSSGCGDVLNLADLQTAKKHQIFEAEVITGKSGGVAGGSDIDYATNQVTGQTQKTLPAVLRDAGFRPASFTFTSGGTLTENDSDRAVLWPIPDGGDGNYYVWKGSYPKTIPAMSTPGSSGGVSESGWWAFGDITLRSWVENGFVKRAFSSVAGSFSTGGVQETYDEAVIDPSTGLFWTWVGALPRTVLAGESPYSNTSWVCVGRLNGYPINDLSSWKDADDDADSTILVQQFFRSLNYFGFSSAVLNGNLTITDRIECYDIAYDMSGATLTLPLDSLAPSALSNGSIFHTSEPDTSVVSGFSAGFNYMNQDSASALTSFGDGTFAWEAENTATDKAYLRDDGQVVMKTGICVMTVTDRAIFRSTPNKYIVNSTVTAQHKPFKNEITIKLPKVVLTGAYASSSQLEQVFQVTRNNVRVIGGEITANLNTQQKVRSLIAVQRCANVKISNLTFKGALTSYEYGVSYFNVANLTVEDCCFLRGWAFIDGNFCRNLIVQRCTVAGKFGGHVGVYDFTVLDCKLYGISLPGSQATGGATAVGGGTFRMSRCTYFYAGGNHAEENLFGTRQDYGQAWDGDVIIEDIDVVYNASNAAFSCVHLAGAYKSTLDYTTNNCFFGRRVSVKNIRIRPATAALAASAIRVRPVGFSRAPNWTMPQRFPDDVTVSDIKAYNFDGTLGGLRLVLDIPGYQSDTTRWVQSTFNCSVENVNLSGGLAWQLTPPTPSTAASVITQNIKFSNCTGKLGAILAGKGDTYEFNNMQLDNISVPTSAASSLTVKVKNCDLTASTCGSNNAGDKFYFYECHGTYSTGTLNVGSRAVYCHGNTIPAGGALTGRTFDEWFAYRDPSVFRTV